MGYGVSMELTGVVIPRSEVKKCREAINKLHADANRGYSWVRGSSEGEGFRTLVDAFREWRYEARVEDNGTVVVEYFEGEKLGDDDVLFSTIAPFVKKGAEIKCRGEDGDRWRHLFDGKIMVEQRGRVVYEDV